MKLTESMNRAALRIGLVLLLLVSCTTVPGGRRASDSAALAAFQRRLDFSGSRLEAIVQAAESAARRSLAYPDVHIHYPWPQQPDFSSEFIARSGGLGNWFTADDKRNTTNDIVLCTVRSWEKDAAEARRDLARYRANGWLIILFASRAGMPDDLPVDFLIDNAAGSGAETEGCVNLLANTTAGWMWTCEYAAALTRHGKHPGVFKSAFYPDEEKHNVPIAQKTALFDCDRPVPAGELAAAYRQRVQKLLADLKGRRVQTQVARAADVIAGRLAEGKRVGIASCDHLLPYELFREMKSPFHPFFTEDRGQAAWDANTKPGELVVWFGYIGLSTKYEDYGGWMRARRLDLVTCYVPDTHLTNNAPDALAHIDQTWKIGDAEVEIPFPPGKMAPVSSLDQVLLFRMVDDAVAERLAKCAGPGKPGQGF